MSRDTEEALLALSKESIRQSFTSTYLFVLIGTLFYLNSKIELFFYMSIVFYILSTLIKSFLDTKYPIP